MCVSVAKAVYITCPKCGEVKPDGHFNKWKRQCKECRAEVQRAYVERHRATVYDRSREWRGRTGHERKRSLRESYGMTPEAYESMFAAQGFRCAICRGVPASSDGRRPPVDHCHVTGAIRGILCTQCNVGIAQFRDNPDRLAAAIAYLAKFQDH